MKINRLVLLIALGVMSFQNLALGELTFEVETVNTTADSTVTLTVSAYDTDGTASLTSYGFAMDFGGGGLGLPSGLTFTPLTGANNLVAGNLNAFEPTPGTGNYDLDMNHAALIGLGGTALPLDATPTDLFNIEFQVAASATGFYAVEILPFGTSSPNEQFEFAGNDLGNPSIVQGGIQVAAVPEPGAFAVLLSVGLISMCRRRRQS